MQSAREYLCFINEVVGLRQVKESFIKKKKKNQFNIKNFFLITHWKFGIYAAWICINLNLY